MSSENDPRDDAPAEDLLEAYETRWAGKVDPVYEEMRY